MSKLFTLILSGAVTGGLFAILASGLVLTYQVSGVFNFAYGAIAFVAALTFFELHTGSNWPTTVAALVTVLGFGPLLGALLDLAMLRKLARAGTTAQIVATIGLTIALPAAGLFIVQQADLHSASDVSNPPGVGPAKPTVWHLTDKVSLDSNQVAVLAAAGATALLLWFIVRRTPLGLQMRACVDRRDLASLRGVDPGRSSLTASMLSTTLAALAGVLGAPFLSLGSDSFTQAMLVSAAAAVFARLTSIPIAFLGGLAIGVVENLVAGYVSPHVSFRGLSSATPFLLIFIGLLLLNATRGRRAGTVSDEKLRDTDISQLPLWRRAGPWTVATIGLLVWITQADDVWLGYTIAGLCLALVFVSFTVVTGIGGMVSLAQATFVTSAALSAGYFLAHGWSFVTALLVGTAIAGAVGALVSLPALRLGGLPLALSTLAIAYIGDLLVFQLDSVRNQSLGWTIPRPTWFGIDFDSLTTAGNRNFAFLLFILVLLAVVLVRNLERSPSGRAMLALRSSQTAAEASGVSTPRQKFAIFTLSSALAGFGGVLYASYNGGATNVDHVATEGLVWLAVVVAFGVRRPGYAVVAGLVYALSPHIISDYVTTSSYLPTILFGLGGIGLAKNPDGFMSDMAEEGRRFLAKMQGRRQPAEAVATAAATPAATPAAAPATTPAAGVGDSVPAQNQPPAGEAAAAHAESEALPVAGSDGSALLSVRGLRAGYDGIEVLHGIDLDLHAGHVVAVLGPNGAGKSTLCAVLAGQVPATGGSVELDSKKLGNSPAHKRSRTGIMLAPESRGIFAGLTVEENLRLSLDADEREKVYERFPVLRERRRVAAGVLSGGEQQMLTLAPLLVRVPRVLIADEPSLGLAPRIVAEVMEVFGEVARAGAAVLLVEEKLHGIADVADQVVALDLGRVAWNRPAKDVDAAALAATYLGVTEQTAAAVEAAAAGHAGSAPAVSTGG
jgi:ABC-type branched-subunit amino acid transport system ATPase component/branched-subunit amino acid ABC-type transport system permease component